MTLTLLNQNSNHNIPSREQTVELFVFTIPDFTSFLHRPRSVQFSLIFETPKRIFRRKNAIKAASWLPETLASVASDVVIWKLQVRTGPTEVELLVLPGSAAAKGGCYESALYKNTTNQTNPWNKIQRGDSYDFVSSLPNGMGGSRSLPSTIVAEKEQKH